MSARSISPVVLGVILALGLAPAAWSSTVPPKPTHFVTDGAAALLPDTVTQLERELHEYQSATGHQVIVYIGETTGNEPLETYTVNAAQRWKVGHKGKDDGVVLFLFMRDHHVRIEVGYGLEGDLPDARAKQIIDETIVPQLKAGNTDAAVASGVAAILTTISPQFKPSQPVSAASTSQSSSDTDYGDPPGWLVLTVFLAFIPVVMLVFGTIRWLFTLPWGLKAADKAFVSTPALFFGSGWGTSSSSSGGGDDGFSDFSGGGGSFGGGGASGSW